MSRPSTFDQLRVACTGFVSDRWPALLCASCKLGHLKAGSIGQIETAASASARSHPDWDADWIEGYFHGELRCGRSECKEIAVVAGDYQIGIDPDASKRHDYTYADFLTVRFMLPAPAVMTYPLGTPDSVVKRIDEAVSLLFHDPNASGNRARVAIEHLITQLGIARFRLQPKPGQRGTRVALSTHNRLQRLGTKHPEAAELLMAVK